MQLTISEIRAELLRATNSYGASGGAAASAVTGMLFHEVAAGLIGEMGWRAALEEGELGDTARLTKYAYETLLGPRITELQASLKESGAEALAVWEAVQAVCQWLCHLLSAAAKQGTIRYDHLQRTWVGAEALCQPELELHWQVKEPGWAATVKVVGVADALWKNPQTGNWCVLEYKLGKPRPEADLAQACLYHNALSASGLTDSQGALALVTFGPELQERFYGSGEIAEAQVALRALIGRLANVLPEPAEKISQSQPSEPKPKDSEQTKHFSEVAIELGHKIKRVFAQYGVAVEWNGDVAAGPRIFRYTVTPGSQVKIRQVKALSEELGIHLQLKSEPIIQNAEGRLVIDVERPDPQTVTFRSIVGQLPEVSGRGSSRAPLGVDLDGQLQFVDLASPNSPHLLVAGTSGSGKSEWLRSCIAGLMYSNTPETLRLVLIDPKRTAFGQLKGSAFLYGSKELNYSSQDAIVVLEELISEMERRYGDFEQTATSDLGEWQAKTGKVLPRIVCICDEYADLLVDKSATRELAAAVTRLGAKARAAGIHLVIATQYPNKQVVEGALKTNLGGRICLRVTNHHQSNMIINESGAERLSGNGDLFFLSIGKPVRLQAPYLSEEERTELFRPRAFAAGETSR